MIKWKNSIRITALTVGIFLLTMIFLPETASADICDEALEKCLISAGFAALTSSLVALVQNPYTLFFRVSVMAFHCAAGYVWCREFV